MPQTFTVSSPAIPDSFEPVRLSGVEGINMLFEYELLLKTPDASNFSFGSAADIDLDGCIGREISCRIELDGAGQFVSGAKRADPRPTGQADQEVYQWHDSRAGSHYVQPRAGTGANEPLAEGQRLARLRMQALRTHGARAKASGQLRGMVPGCTFKLLKHPREAANRASRARPRRSATCWAA